MFAAAVIVAIGLGGFVCGVVYSDLVKREVHKDVGALRNELDRVRALIRF